MAQLQQGREQALKLKNFFKHLIRLASDQISSAVGKIVKELVQSVMEGTLTEEQFAAILQATVNSPPQPNLVRFLKKTLPWLRAQSRLPQSNTGQKNLPQQHVQQKTSTPTHTGCQQAHKTNAEVQKKHKQVIFTPAQEQLLECQNNTQRVPLTSSVGAVSCSQVVTNPRNVMIHLPQGRTDTKVVVSSARSQTGNTAASAEAADKLKAIGFTGINSSGDDDMNDATSMAGVNIVVRATRTANGTRSRHVEKSSQGKAVHAQSVATERRD